MSGAEPILVKAAGPVIGATVAPAVEAGKGICRYLKRTYHYIFHLKRIFEGLEKEAKVLFARGNDINRQIRDGQPREPTSEWTVWTEEVETTRIKVLDLETRYRTVTASHLLSSLCDRRKLSKKIVKMTKSVVSWLDKGDLGRPVLVQRQPPDSVPWQYPKNIFEVPSLSEHVKKLRVLLEDDEIKRIGIWGVFGVGKTTILDILRREVEKEQIYGNVLWVKVKSDPCEMQRDIMRQLRIQAFADDVGQLAELISRQLIGKRYLLLVDGVCSSDFDLHCIGYRANHNCKVVLTTRERQICKTMKTDEVIKVGKLSRQDARKLFRDIVGEESRHPSLEPIAERVLEQCGDLAQVIKAIGNYLKNKHSEDLWRTTLLKLQSPIMFKLKDFEDVYNSFMATYEELDDNSKTRLLHAALFPDDHEIYRDYLVECWKVEKLIDNDKTFRLAREEGHESLDGFVDSFLFDVGRSSEFVKMPIIFRNAARRVANDHHFVSLDKDSEETEDSLPMESWKNAKVISFNNSTSNKLPPGPIVCSAISTFRLQKNKMLLEIPPSFFDLMSTLKILDLSGTCITSLPASVKHLKSLKGLYLNECDKLVHLPELKELELELLDICGTGILDFRVVIGGLIHLKCLRASFTSIEGNQNCVKANDSEITPSTLEELKRLEELKKLEELTIRAEPEDQKWQMVAPKIVAEIAKLENLSALSFYFPDIKSLEDFIQNSMSWKTASCKFRSFNIYVCSKTHNPPSFDVYGCVGKRYLYYTPGEDTHGEDTPSVIIEVLKRTCAFQLVNHKRITYFSAFGIDEMKCLEVCQVEGCNAMIAFLGSQIATSPSFQWLRELYLCQLQHLTAISEDPITEGSFASLTTLVVEDCPNFEALVGNQSCGADVFPKLKTLKLSRLEGLVRVLHNDSFTWPKLENMLIDGCPKLVDLCLSRTNAKKLIRIDCSRDWWDEVKSNAAIASLERFCYFLPQK